MTTPRSRRVLVLLGLQAALRLPERRSCDFAYVLKITKGAE